MDRETRRMIEEFRREQANPIENNLIDEWHAGMLDRGELLRRGAMFGLSASVIGGLLGASPAAGAVRHREAVKAGGTLRVAILAPTKPPEPSQVADEGGLAVISIVGEFLTFSDAQLNLKPWLATSWKPNAAATVWTFQIRKGVKFHNGQTMTADDVVKTFKVLTRPELRGGVRLQGDPLAERRRQDGPVHGAVPPRPADRRLPVPRQPDDLPGDDPPEELHARDIRGLEDARHRPVQVRQLQPAERGAVRPQHRLLGRRAAARRRQAVLLPGHRDRRCSRSAAARSTSCSSSRPRRRRRSGTTRSTRPGTRRPRTTASSACAPTSRRSTTPGCAGRSRSL